VSLENWLRRVMLARHAKAPQPRSRSQLQIAMHFQYACWRCDGSIAHQPLHRRIGAPCQHGSLSTVTAVCRCAAYMATTACLTTPKWDGRAMRTCTVTQFRPLFYLRPSDRAILEYGGPSLRASTKVKLILNKVTRFIFHHLTKSTHCRVSGWGIVRRQPHTRVGNYRTSRFVGSRRSFGGRTSISKTQMPCVMITCCVRRPPSLGCQSRCLPGTVAKTSFILCLWVAAAADCGLGMSEGPWCR
jgi:hypothetical protein